MQIKKRHQLIAILSLAVAVLGAAIWVRKPAAADGGTLASAVDAGDEAEVAEILRRDSAAREVGRHGADSGILVRAITSERYRDNARRARIVAMLAEAGADIDGPAGQWTPLDHAVQERQAEVVEVLLAKGADRQGHIGPGGLFRLAVIVDRLPIAQMLFAAGAKPDFNENNPAIAAKNANAPMLAWLLKIGYPLQPEPGRSEELLEAIDSDCGACVALLLDAGVTFELNRAASGAGLNWFRYIGMGAGPKVLTALAAHGFRLNGVDEEGNSLLHPAAQGQHVETIKWLLEQGLKVDARNGRGETPLMLAAYALEPDIVRTLLEAKADIALHDKNLHTAKWHARWASGNDEKASAAMIALLEQHGAKEYVGQAMPRSRYDAELDRERMSDDVTEDIYERLPMLAPNTRFFRVALKGREVSRLYAVLPGTKVVSMQSSQAFPQLGIRLRTKEDALQFVDFLSNPRAPMQERPEFGALGLNCHPAYSKLERDAWGQFESLLRSPEIEQRGAGAQALFVIRRLLEPKDARRSAVPVEETVSPNGGYALRPLHAAVPLDCDPVHDL